MATPGLRSTITGGERAIAAMHGWNLNNGPGKLFHDLLITEACQILSNEYQNGNRTVLTAQAVRNIWDHAQLTSLWDRNSESELKATIRALLNHRRSRFASGLRRDWPSSVPKPPFRWFKQINDGTVDAGQTNQSDNMIPLFNSIPLSNMVLIVSRRNGNGGIVGYSFGIRIARLLFDGQDTVTDCTMLDINALIYYLENQTFAFNAQTEALVWTDKENGHVMPINEQSAFEAALQIQYNSGLKNLELHVVGNAMNSENVYSAHSANQPQPTNYPTPEESSGQYIVNPGSQTMPPALQGDDNYGGSDELSMRFDHTPSNAHPLFSTQNFNHNISSPAQQTAGPLGAGPSVNDE